MAGILRFTIFAAILVGLLAFVALPLVGRSLITTAVRDAGLEADDVDVSVDLFGLGLLSGRAPSVRVVADDVTVPRALIGHVDLTFTDVSMTDRTFASVTGRLNDVRVTGPQGRAFTVTSVELDGPAASTRARGQIDATQGAAFVESVARDAGLELDGITLGDGHVVLEAGGESTTAALRVEGDALILAPAEGEAVVLLAAAPSEKWSLTHVRVSADGLRIDVEIDARDLAAGVTAP